MGRINRKIYLYICWHTGISNKFNLWPRHWGTSVQKFQIYLAFLLRKCHSYEYSFKGQPVYALLRFSICGHNDWQKVSCWFERHVHTLIVNANHSKLVYIIALNHLFISPPAYPISPLRLTPPHFCLRFAVWGRHITAGAVCNVKNEISLLLHISVWWLGTVLAVSSYSKVLFADGRNPTHSGRT